MGDEARIPPPLDSVGAKLNADYVKQVIDKGAHDRPYMYTQMPGPMLWGGRTWQFPLFWGPVLQVFLFGFTAVFLHRDDRGRTICYRWSQRLRPFGRRPFVRRPFLGEVAVATIVLTLSYLLGIGFMATARLTHHANSLARPWPHEDTKVYDPQNQYRVAGEPGPYQPGIWSFGQSKSDSR